MRLIVAPDRAAVNFLQQEFPDDKVVCVGDPLRAYRFTELVDLTLPLSKKTRQWWDSAKCRIEA